MEMAFLGPPLLYNEESVKSAFLLLLSFVFVFFFSSIGGLGHRNGYLIHYIQRATVVRLVVLCSNVCLVHYK